VLLGGVVKLGPVYIEVNARAINRPHFSTCWIDDDHYDVALSWGNGSSDPVWFVSLNVTVPPRVARYLDRRDAS